MISPEVFHHYKTGNLELDDSHWAAISKLTEAATASSSIPPQLISYVLFLFDEGITLFEEHFVMEDMEMIKSGFPYYKEHKSDHDSLMRDLKELRDRMEAKKLYFSTHYAIYVWQRKFLEHIDHYDLQAHKHKRDIK